MEWDGVHKEGGGDPSVVRQRMVDGEEPAWRGGAVVKPSDCIPLAGEGVMRLPCTLPLARLTGGKHHGSWKRPAILAVVLAARSSYRGLVQDSCTRQFPKLAVRAGDSLIDVPFLHHLVCVLLEFLTTQGGFHAL